MRRLYLDNAATSHPKPESVYTAVDRYQRDLGAAVGRGGFSAAVAAGATVTRCRARIAELLGAESPERIIFGFNGTDVLNLALHGLLRPGDKVVTTQLEHNSVIRPLRTLRERLGVDVTVVSADKSGRVGVDAFRAALVPGTRLAVLVHASNVTGAILPITDLASAAREAGALVLVDAAQTAGHVPIDLRQLPIDLLGCSGHKGLLGPLGTGVLYIRPGIEPQLQSIRQGGTGTSSEDDQQPESLPEKYESGNHNAPGLFGLEAGVQWVLERTVASLHAHEATLIDRLIEGLRGHPAIRLWGPPGGIDRVGVLSLTVEGFDPHELAAILDQSFGIATRAGLHCAPGAHRALGTFSRGGTLRLSVGPFNTFAEMDFAVDALRQIAG